MIVECLGIYLFLENFFSRQLLQLREFFLREENDDKNRSDQLLLVKYLDQSFCRLASGYKSARSIHQRLEQRLAFTQKRRHAKNKVISFGLRLNFHFKQRNHRDWIEPSILGPWHSKLGTAWLSFGDQVFWYELNPFEDSFDWMANEFYKCIHCSPALFHYNRKLGWCYFRIITFLVSDSFICRLATVPSLLSICYTFFSFMKHFPSYFDKWLLWLTLIYLAINIYLRL